MWVKENGEEYTLPKLNKTNEELFFIGYAQVCMVSYIFFLYIWMDFCKCIEYAKKQGFRSG